MKHIRTKQKFLPFKSPKFKIKKGSSVRKTFLLYKPDGMTSDPSHLCKAQWGHASVISVLGGLLLHQ